MVTNCAAVLRATDPNTHGVVRKAALDRLSAALITGCGVTTTFYQCTFFSYSVLFKKPTQTEKNKDYHRDSDEDDDGDDEVLRLTAAFSSNQSAPLF